jgi:alpha 1,2-mannosyltransferase
MMQVRGMAATRLNAAIFYLTQNTEVRRTHLKTSLYFLFRHGNATHKYPVVILHEGDYDAKAQRDVLMSVRSSCRSLVTFRALDDGDFALPPHIDRAKMEHCIATRATPYWRNEKYRMMCRWWLVHFPKYAAGYDYVMRLDDDSIIEEPVPDLFKWADQKALVYASNMLHVDCGICCYGMKEFFEKLYPHKKNELREAFMSQEIPMRAVDFHPFRTLLSITQNPLPEIPEKMRVHMPLMWYNNFFITKTSFWQRPDVQEAIRKIDENGSIFYFRWGDAPLQTLLVTLHAAPSEYNRAVFKYSKRMQREAFQGDDGEYHSYMPTHYEQSSCVIEDKKFEAS